MTEFNSLDIGIMVIVGLSALTGVSRGLIKSLVSAIGWICVTVLTYHSKPYLIPTIEDKISSPALASIIAYSLAGLFYTIAFSIINSVVLGLLSRLRRSPIDKILGLGFGLVRGAFFSLIIFICFGKIFAVFNDGNEEDSMPDFVVESVSYPYLDEGKNALFAAISGEEISYSHDDNDSGISLVDIAKLSQFASDKGESMMKMLNRNGANSSRGTNGGGNAKAEVVNQLLEDYKDKIKNNKVYRGNMLSQSYIKELEEKVSKELKK